jgi:hypothetical protein
MDGYAAAFRSVVPNYILSGASPPGWICGRSRPMSAKAQAAAPAERPAAGDPHQASLCTRIAAATERPAKNSISSSARSATAILLSGFKIKRGYSPDPHYRAEYGDRDTTRPYDTEQR